jgi:uncharacterized membrane protein YphA (DoxX/SURF4 family)
MFPTGLPGVALVLLRASAVTALLGDQFSHRQDLSGWIHGSAIIISIALIAGCFTPFAALLGLVHGLLWSGLSTGNTAAAIIIALNSIALTLLGPGAYSVDSYRFGRRVVVLPPP